MATEEQRKPAKDIKLVKVQQQQEATLPPVGKTMWGMRLPGVLESSQRKWGMELKGGCLVRGDTAGCCVEVTAAPLLLSPVECCC